MSVFLTAPYSIDIAGVDMKIDPCFRNALNILSMLRDVELNDDIKVDLFIYKLYTAMQDDEFAMLMYMEDNIKAHLMDGANWFLSCGVTDKEQSTKRPVLDIEQDWQFVVSAFLIKGIDLLDPNLKLHWWTFQKHLEELPKDCHLVRIMYLRSLKNDGKLNKKEFKAERAEYNKIGEKIMVIAGDVPKVMSQEEYMQEIMALAEYHQNQEIQDGNIEQ